MGDDHNARQRRTPRGGNATASTRRPVMGRFSSPEAAFSAGGAASTVPHSRRVQLLCGSACVPAPYNEATATPRPRRASETNAGRPFQREPPASEVKRQLAAGPSSDHRARYTANTGRSGPRSQRGPSGRMPQCSPCRRTTDPEDRRVVTAPSSRHGAKSLAATNKTSPAGSSVRPVDTTISASSGRPTALAALE